jgi:hypothetical protein
MITIFSGFITVFVQISRRRKTLFITGPVKVPRARFISGCNITLVGGLLSAGAPFTPEMMNWDAERVMETAETWKKDCDFLFTSFAQPTPVATGEL